MILYFIVDFDVHFFFFSLLFSFDFFESLILLSFILCLIYPLPFSNIYWFLNYSKFPSWKHWKSNLSSLMI